MTQVHSRLATADVSGADRALAGRPAELGDFRLLREIGRGGMGVVYEAEQKSLGRRVALKVLPYAAMFDARHLQRFKNEARAAALLDHPHIVAVHTVGCQQDVHFYTMQLIEGKSLADVIAGWRRAPVLMTQGPELSFRQIARWGAEACEALEHAHQMGIVHRDVKPSNLLVNEQGHLWVADFGLATTGDDSGLDADRRYSGDSQIHESRAVPRRA